MAVSSAESTPCVRSAGVVGTLATPMRPLASSRSATSVNVPPISTPIRHVMPAIFSGLKEGMPRLRARCARRFHCREAIYGALEFVLSKYPYNVFKNAPSTRPIRCSELELVDAHAPFLTDGERKPEAGLH